MQDDHCHLAVFPEQTDEILVPQHQALGGFNRGHCGRADALVQQRHLAEEGRGAEGVDDDLFAVAARANGLCLAGYDNKEPFAALALDNDVVAGFVFALNEALGDLAQMADVEALEQRDLLQCLDDICCVNHEVPPLLTLRNRGFSRFDRLKARVRDFKMVPVLRYRPHTAR